MSITKHQVKAKSHILSLLGNVILKWQLKD